MRNAYLLLFVGSIVEGDATLVTAGFVARRGYLHILTVRPTGRQLAIPLLEDPSVQRSKSKRGFAMLCDRARQ